ncbi:MAG TPA: hypothetical protein VM889_11490 [Candidatus Thermoplasmatota archaeon]|nr:hypothetical protein [Candidatus Thermoplasmatota archaeon]
MSVRALVALLLAVALLAPVAQARDHKDDDDRDDDRPRKADRETRPKPWLGEFSTAPGDRNVTGEFVRFNWTDAGITGYAVGSTPWFDVAIDGSRHDARESRGTAARGASIDVETARYSLKAHDRPKGQLVVRTDGVASLKLAAGVSIHALENGVRLSTEHHTAILTARGDGLDVQGDVVSAEGGFTFSTLGRPSEHLDPAESQIAGALADKRLGAEVAVVKENGAVRNDVVSYRNVTVATTTGDGKVTFTIDGHGFDGRVLVFRVDPALVGNASIENLRLTFDGAPMTLASNLTDVLNPDDDGLIPEAWLVSDTEGYQLIASVPHYSVHVLSLEGLIREAPPSVVVGLVAGALILGVGTLVLFRRPKA